MVFAPASAAAVLFRFYSIEPHPFQAMGRPAANTHVAAI